jgi:hypothetical protein
VSPHKTWASILGGNRNVDFDDLVRLAFAFGFLHKRTRGSHMILSHPDLPGLLNLQPDRGKAKPYQVRQLMALVERYNLRLKGKSEP